MHKWLVLSASNELWEAHINRLIYHKNFLKYPQQVTKGCMKQVFVAVCTQWQVKHNPGRLESFLWGFLIGKHVALEIEFTFNHPPCKQSWLLSTGIYWPFNFLVLRNNGSCFNGKEHEEIMPFCEHDIVKMVVSEHAVCWYLNNKKVLTKIHPPEQLRLEVWAHRIPAAIADLPKLTSCKYVVCHQKE